MTDPAKNSEDIFRKLSRRNMLRDSAITTAGIVLLPSFITGCRKVRHFPPGHGGPGGVGVGDDELTNFELYSASQNLLNMYTWVENLYPYCIEYETIVYGLLQGDKPSGWKNFILDIFSQIGVGIFEAAADEIPGAGAAIALAGDNIKNWISGSVPGNLDAAYTEFVDGHLKMQIAITDMLLTLADIGKITDNDYPYQNLKAGFKEDIVFNGKTYTLRDLAGSQFPSDAQGEDFIALRAAAFNKFRQHMWNVMIIKTGTMYYSSEWNISCDADHNDPNNNSYSPCKYAAEVHYKDSRYIGTYLRGYSADYVYRFVYWYFYVNGYELSADAVKELFKDDYPGHIINPSGLFLRDYVFKQFHTTKPDFSDRSGIAYHELLSTDRDSYCNDAQDFNLDADNYTFTAGDIPALIQP